MASSLLGIESTADKAPSLKRDICLDIWFKDEENDRYVKPKLQKFRQDLPIFQRKPLITSLTENNKVILIKGETGCGKTTQVPQYILEDCIENGRGSVTNILVTQPRRISAVSVATRVAEERGEIIGEKSRQESSVGYEIRFESKKPREKCGVTFVTTGVVFQMLRSDPTLGNFSHIILDEVHERDLFTDILLGVLKDMIKSGINPNLKIVVMSASLDVQKFQYYFDICPVVNVEGRTKKVEELFLEDFVSDLGQVNELDALRHTFKDMSMNFTSLRGTYNREYGYSDAKKICEIENPDNVLLDAYAKLIHKIDRDHRGKPLGAILVFLPGWDEISRLEKMLTEYRNVNFLGDAEVICLHSQLNMAKQVRVFQPAAKGIRKVILSTNIAETSITIDDVVYVIDSGRINVMRYNPVQKASSLMMEWISKSNAIQRKGRAGRVRDGMCWHMYTRKKFEGLRDYLDPDIKRLQLESVILNIKSLKLRHKSVHEFMENLVESPSYSTIDHAKRNLIKVGAIDDSKYYDTEFLTPLGLKMAGFPLHPNLAKMLIMSCIFKCLDPILNIVSVLNEKDPFQLQHWGDRKKLDEARKVFSKGVESDHLMFANVINAWEEAYEAQRNEPFCRDYHLNERVLLDVYNIKIQLKAKLMECQIMVKDEDYYNQNAKNVELLKGVIAMGLYPSVRPIQRCPRKGFYFLTDLEEDNRRVYINQKSILSKNPRITCSWMAYFNIRGNRQGNVGIPDGTCLNNYLIELFTPKQGFEYESSFKRDLQKTFIDEYLAGNHTRQDEMVREVCVLMKN